MKNRVTYRLQITMYDFARVEVVNTLRYIPQLY